MPTSTPKSNPSVDNEPREEPEWVTINLKSIEEYVRSQPYFTLDGLNEAQAALPRIESGTGTYTVRGWSGQEVNLPVEGPVKLKYNSWQMMGIPYYQAEGEKRAGPYFAMQEDEEETKARTQDLLSPEDKKKHRDEFDSLVSTWKKSQYYRELTECLTKGLADIKPINQIVCFALGNFSYRGSRHQHLAARTIREILESDGGKHHAKDVKIYAQDPLYCLGTKELLRDVYGITVVDNPMGFQMLTERTFIVTVAPLVPVRQMVMDFLDDVGGPAGMLCRKIDDDGTVFRNGGKYKRGDEDSLFDDMGFTADESSPRVAAFKDQCYQYLINDDEKNGMGFNTAFIGAAQNALYVRRKSVG